MAAVAGASSVPNDFVQEYAMASGSAGFPPSHHSQHHQHPHQQQDEEGHYSFSGVEGEESEDDSYDDPQRHDPSRGGVLD